MAMKLKKAWVHKGRIYFTAVELKGVQVIKGSFSFERQ